MMSGLVLTLLTLFWEPLPGEPLWHGPIWIVAVSMIGLLAVGVCAMWYDHAAFFGLTYIATPGRLRTDGPYRYVRHPLMLGLLIALWGQPIMPPELFVLNVGMTLYVLFAIQLEERDMLRQFGDEYEQYRNEVPALIPFLHRARNLRR